MSSKSRSSRCHYSEPFDLQQTDQATDQILKELSAEEIRGAQNVMAQLLRGVREQRFKLRPELVHSVLVCALLLSRHACRRNELSVTHA